MENSIYTGLSRQMALQSDMNTIANNLANVNTPGYRGQYMLFTEYVENPKGIEDPLSMVEDYGQYISNKPGPMTHTGNPLDVAMQGPGFIGITRGGETFYTRAGNFMLGENGDLITPTGDRVASAGGSPITIPEGAKSVSIAEDGMVSTENGAVGQIMMTEFENINDLDAIGDNLYSANAPGTPATDTRMISGMVEGSNVNPIMEMTRMIDTQRAYQSAARMLQSEHDRQRTMIQRLSQAQ
jgi:flagellar basal-body rod protein FlgF